MYWLVNVHLAIIPRRQLASAAKIRGPWPIDNVKWGYDFGTAKSTKDYGWLAAIFPLFCRFLKFTFQFGRVMFRYTISEIVAMSGAAVSGRNGVCGRSLINGSIFCVSCNHASLWSQEGRGRGKSGGKPSMTLTRLIDRWTWHGLLGDVAVRHLSGLLLLESNLNYGWMERPTATALQYGKFAHHPDRQQEQDQ